MIESLLAQANKNKSAINLDWKSAVVGSKSIVDLSGNVWTPGSGNSYTSQVVNDASRGLVWQSNGDVTFSTPVMTSLYLSGKSFVFEFEIKNADVGWHNLGGTGDYNQGISSGIGIVLGQFSANYYQAFLMGPGTTFNRLSPATTRTDKWTRVVITRTVGSGFKMDLYHDDDDPTTPFASTTVPEVAIGNGSGYWWLFRLPNSPTPIFKGLLNFWRVTIN